MQMQSPDARQYDEVQTPDSGGGGTKRKFGVRRRTFDASTKSVVENARDGRGAASNETAEFARARRLSVIGRQAADAEGFDFSANGRHASAPVTRPARFPTADGNGLGGSGGKYVQPTGKAVKVGLSFGATANEEEARLRQLPTPPAKQDSFLSNITKIRKPALVLTSSRAPSQRVAKRAAGSLESASAPTEATSASSANSRGDWIPPMRMTREQASEQRPKRTRVDLTPPQPRRVPSVASSAATSSTRASPRLLNRPTGRNTLGMYDGGKSSPSTTSVICRYEKKESRSRTQEREAISSLGLRRSSRSSAKTKEGTEDMPIHLSDSDDEDDMTSRNGDDQAAADQLEAVVDDELDMEEVRKGLLSAMQAQRVWIGEFAIRVDLYICEDIMWLCSIRGVEKKWPLAKNYRIYLNKVKRAMIYRWEASQAGAFDTTDPAGKVMSTISFLALQFPIPVVREKFEWREFYDPSAQDAASSKAFVIIAARDEDRDGTAFGTVEDVIRNKGVEVELLNTLDDVRPLARPMIKHDHHFLFHSRPKTDELRRTRRRRGADDDMDATQLTYPLPPCTVDLVTITRQDIGRLRPAEYLNDNIIDYYLKRLLVEDYASNQLVKQNVLFLSSHFYSRLRAGQGVSQKERLAAGYKNVSTWLTRSDLFRRTLIFVPINKDLHWSLAVIVNPKCAGAPAVHDKDTGPQTCIALLDPLGSYHSSIPIVRNLKSFLEFEWERVFRANEYRPENVSKIQVSAPLQSNSFDCGVYVLKYAQEMLTNFAQLLAAKSEDSKDTFLLPRAITDDKLAELIPQGAFTSRHVTSKRTELQELLVSDTKAYEAILDTKQEVKLFGKT